MLPRAVIHFTVVNCKNFISIIHDIVQFLFLVQLNLTYGLLLHLLLLLLLLGSTSRTKIYEGDYPHRLQACRWLTRLMPDRHVRPPWLQLKLWSGMASELPMIVLLQHFSLTVSNMCWLLVVVNVAVTEGLLEGVFKTFLWCSSIMVASGEFSIQGYL